MTIVYVGESWHGSCARSLREALVRHPHVALTAVDEVAAPIGPRTVVRRVAARLRAPWQRREFAARLDAALAAQAPGALVAYKGWPIDAALIERVRASGVLTVNVYPDCSPHAHGSRHRRAVGAYDLVVSTKPFHPPLWRSLYGYANECVFVPQGYDPELHLDPTEPGRYDRDVGLIATWRPEYGALMAEVAHLLPRSGTRVGIGGNGWHGRGLPTDWELAGPLTGRAYVDWLRASRICIAPVTTDVWVGGVRQPGDVDTTRTYELAAARCFFVHRDTDYVRTLYDPRSEVPLFRNAADLVALIGRYLPREAERRAMADAAFRRAVPAYSLDGRAEQIVALLRDRLRVRRAGVGR